MLEGLDVVRTEATVVMEFSLVYYFLRLERIEITRHQRNNGKGMSTVKNAEQALSGSADLSRDKYYSTPLSSKHNKKMSHF